MEHKGKRINDFVQLSEVDGIGQDSVLTLVEDPYTEKEARIHVLRIRELIGAAGNRSDLLQGISAGVSLLDSVHTKHLSADGQAPTNPAANPLTDYKFETPASLENLVAGAQEASPKVVKGLSVSPWNPPPHFLRQQGHLLYLVLTTQEGEQFHITSHVSGFYVNRSNAQKFDPSPRAGPKSFAAHSLLNLISDLSPSFKESFKKLQEYNNTNEPLAVFQVTNAIPSNPWIVPAASTSAHESDLTRTQETYLISGIENTETLRDWNEEFQSTRELPKDNVQDRVLRERLTSKLFADYNDAAVKGAVLVARGEVAPLNPTEERDAQIFVYNNVFFSFGADGVGTFASEGGDEAARVATGKDVMGVRMVNQLDIEGLYTPGTVVVDYLGKRLVGQSIVPGIFRQRDPEENQIDYGAVDGKDVVASNEKFTKVFETLSKALKVKKHTVWDKDNKQHVLEGSVETKGLLGTDGRKYVLDLYRITPLDIAWMEEVGSAIGGSESATDGEKKKSTYPHRMTVLRPELVEAFWRSKMREWVNAEVEKRRGAKKQPTIEEASAPSTADEAPKEESKDEPKTNGETTAVEKSSETPAAAEKSTEGEGEQRIDVSDFNFALNPDVFSGQNPQTDAEKAELAADEKDVRDACTYLRESVMPELLHELKEGDIGFPHDGQSLSRLLHKRGINIRYLGKLANAAEGKRLEAVRILAAQEMISRAFKHIAGRYLRYLPVPFTSSCIAHLLNCLLGASLNPKPVAKIDGTMKALYPGVDLSFEDVTPEGLRKEIEVQVKQRYLYTLPEDWSATIKPLQLLRDISLKLGLQLSLKNYKFTAEEAEKPAVNGAVNGTAKEAVVTDSTSSKKKKKKSSNGSPPNGVSPDASPLTFLPEDVQNIVPIVKEAAPKSSLAEEALEAGRISLIQGQKKLGQELLLESLSLHEQIYGILHPEVARAYGTLSMTYYQLEEKEAAVELAKKAVIVSERTVGIDNAETLLHYLNLALFSHASGETRVALAYMKHALELWKIVYGPSHPDSITTINNAAVMLQHLKAYHASRLWFEASLEICNEVFGKQSINAATLLFQLAQALALDQEPKAAVNRMRESYNIFLTELGAEDKNTKEAENWLEQLTQNAVSIAKQARDVQARRGRLGLRFNPRVTLGHSQPQPPMGQATQAAPSRDSRNAVNGLDSRSIDELIKFIEGGETKSSSSKKRPARGNPKRRGAAAVGAKA